MRRLAACLVFGLAGPAAAQDIELPEIDWFVHSNLLHTLYHEAGHAVIDQFDLPVIGQEEDAADSFATYEILNGYDDDVDILVDSAEAMLVSHEMTLATGEAFDYFDEHDLDIQRGLRIICHAVGLDPDRYKEAARWLDMDSDRKDICESDAALVADSWDALLEPHLLPEGADEAPVTAEIVADDGFAREIALLENTGVLDDVRGYLAATYAWPQPIQIIAETCGEANAFYHPDGPTITLCLEFIADMYVIGEEREEASSER